MTNYVGWCPEHGPLKAHEDHREYDGVCMQCGDYCYGPGALATIAALKERDIALEAARIGVAQCAQVQKERNEWELKRLEEKYTAAIKELYAAHHAIHALTKQVADLWKRVDAAEGKTEDAAKAAKEARLKGG